MKRSLGPLCGPQQDSQTRMAAEPAAPDSARRALLIALPTRSRRTCARELPELPTTPVMPLVDRPIIQHALERIRDWGAQRVDVLGDSTDMPLRRVVLDQDRWGMEVRWLNAQHDSDCEPLRSCAVGGRMLVGHLDALPFYDLEDPQLQQGIVSLLTHAAARSPWAFVAGEVLEAMPRQCTLDALWTWMADLHEVQVETESLLAVHSVRALLSSQRRLLEQFVGGESDEPFQLIGRPQDSGVRLCRNVRVHPTAKLTGPVFVGDNSRIGKGAQVGPNSVIGANCIVDHHASVANALVESETYVGPWVEVSDCHVSQARVANIRLQAATQIDDPLVLSKL